jgi:hypothetical protein
MWRTDSGDRPEGRQLTDLLLDGNLAGEEPVAESSPELRNGAAGLRVEGLTSGQRRDSLRR